ncbi:MAG: DoxX family membrane protein [Aureibaculum sp.]|nr:DoxX family membrane protein [Aureibaculum sp.]
MNSKVTTALRLVLGLILIVFGANKFLNFMPMPELTGGAADFMGALGNTGYMFPLIGALEVITGLLLIFNKWVPFALVVIAPLAVNMLLYHLKFDLAGIGGAAVVSLLTVVLIYFNWNHYKSLF